MRGVLMAPFLGLGGETNLGSLKLGVHLRSYPTGLPDHLQSEGGDKHEYAVGVRPR